MITENCIFIGIDWADKTHAYHMVCPDSKPVAGEFKQASEQIEGLIQQWRERYPGCTFVVAIETTKGPLINALLGFDDVIIYPINPAALASFRKAFAHGGGKNDRSDAMLLSDYLTNFRDKLQPLRRDDPITRELAALTEDRRRLVDQRTAVCNELKAVLKRYFPTILELQAAKIYADFILALILKYPTLADAQRAGKAKLLKLFFGLGTKEKIQQRVDTLLDAKPLTEDTTILRIESLRAVALCELLKTYNGQIAKYDKALKELVVVHNDFEIFKSLPAGSFATQGRLIAAMGDDRSRYNSAEELQAASGIAPLTTQSGKQRFVSSRWACSKFMRQTFHEFAGLTIRKCAWADAYYRLQLSRKKSPQMAKRALAYKWQRIIFRCWQSRTPYDDQRYVERLKATGSPLIALMNEDKTVEKKSKNKKTNDEKIATTH